MESFGFLIGFPVFIVAPCVIAGWLGALTGRPVPAFLLTWILTPLISMGETVVLWPLLRALTPPNNDGIGAIMIPFFGVATGLFAGIIAAVVVGRRTGHPHSTPVARGYGQESTTADVPDQMESSDS